MRDITKKTFWSLFFLGHNVHGHIFTFRFRGIARPPGAALLDNNETTAKSATQDGGMAGNFG